MLIACFNITRSQRCDGKWLMSCLILRIFILIKEGVISMAQDIISTIGDLVKWIIDTVNKFTKK